MNPVLKWAGGKSGLINKIISAFPAYVYEKEFCLIEPFFGGGAVGFWALSNLPDRKSVV